MRFRGKLGRPTPVLLVVALLAAALLTLSAGAAAHAPTARAAKKCKRKHHGKRRRCKRSPSPAMISISPASQDFGVPMIGGEDRTFTVTNVGGSPTGVPIPALGQAGTDFSLGPNGCTLPLAPAASCPVDVHVGTAGAGHVSAMLVVTAIPGGTATASATANIEA